MNKLVEELYKELLLVNAPEKMSSTSLGDYYISEKYWDDRYDCISHEEWLETLEIHARQREKLLRYGEV